MITAVRCFACERAHDPRTLLTVCAGCGLPLRVDYDLGAIRLRLRDVAGLVAVVKRAAASGGHGVEGVSNEG